MDLLDIEDMEEEYRESREEYRIEVGKAYRTLDGERAVVMYLVNGKNPIFFGHVEVNGELLGAQWDYQGRYDANFHSDSFDLVSLWEKPTTYIRYVYIHRGGEGAVTTTVTEKPITVTNLIAVKRIVLSGG